MAGLGRGQPARSEQMLDRLAHRSPATRQSRDQGRRRPDFSAGVGHGDSDAAPGDHRQVRQVVADEGGLLPGDTALREHGGRRRQLVVHTLPHDPNAELTGPQLHHVARAAGHDAGLAAGPLPELEPQAVTDVEGLRLDALVVPGHAAVGQDSVHVEQQELHAGQAAVEVGGLGHAGFQSRVRQPPAAAAGAGGSPREARAPRDRRRRAGRPRDRPPRPRAVH